MVFVSVFLVLVFFAFPVYSQSPDGLYDLDVLQSNPDLVQQFPGSSPGSQRTIIVVERRPGAAGGGGFSSSSQQLYDFDAPVAERNSQAIRSNAGSFQEVSRRTQRTRQTGGLSFSDIAREVESDRRSLSPDPLEPRSRRNVNLYDFDPVTGNAR